MCRPKHVELLRNTGIINSTTQSHLFGSFDEIYVNQVSELYKFVTHPMIYASFVFVNSKSNFSRPVSDIKLLKHRAGGGWGGKFRHINP